MQSSFKEARWIPPPIPVDPIGKELCVAERNLAIKTRDIKQPNNLINWLVVAQLSIEDYRVFVDAEFGYSVDFYAEIQRINIEEAAHGLRWRESVRFDAHFVRSGEPFEWNLMFCVLGHIDPK